MFFICFCTYVYGIRIQMTYFVYYLLDNVFIFTFIQYYNIHVLYICLMGTIFSGIWKFTLNSKVSPTLIRAIPLSFHHLETGMISQ